MTGHVPLSLRYRLKKPGSRERPGAADRRRGFRLRRPARHRGKVMKKARTSGPLIIGGAERQHPEIKRIFIEPGPLGGRDKPR